MADEGGQPWSVSIPSGQESWEAGLQAAAQEQRDFAWQRHEQHEANVRAITVRHRREQNQASRSTPRHYRREHSAQRERWHQRRCMVRAYQESDRGAGWSHAQGGPPPKGGFFAGLFGVVLDFFSR